MSLGDLCSPHFRFLNSPRSSGHGGGLVTIFSDSFKCTFLPTSIYSTFEVHLVLINGPAPVLCALVHRPPKASSTFIQEFSDLLTIVASRSDKLLIVGDFNIHVCCPNKPMVSDSLNLVDSLNLSQSVSGPTL